MRGEPDSRAPWSPQHPCVTRAGSSDKIPAHLLPAWCYNFVMMLAKTLMRLALLPASCAAWPALADPIPSAEASRHVGQVATISGQAFLTFMPSGEVYIDLDGQGENSALAGYVSRWNRINFQDLSALNGKKVELSGRIAIFRGQAEIFLRDAGQIKAK